MKIYVDFAKPDTVEEFLQKFYQFGTSLEGQSIRTYEDEGCTRSQCEPSKNRSLEELYYCVTTYFPEVSLEDLIKEIMKLNLKDLCFYPMYCSWISRCVVYFYRYKRCDFPSFRGGKYCWNTLFRGMGFNTIDEVYNYGKL